MKTLILGPINVTRKTVHRAIDRAVLNPTEIVSCASAGTGLFAEEWGMFNSIKIRRFFPNQRKWGKKAVDMMYKNMAKYADGVILLYRNEKELSELTSVLPNYKKPFEIIKI